MSVAPGSVLAFRLDNGMYGACRVIRAPRKDEQPVRKGVLVFITRFVGDKNDAMKSPDLKKRFDRMLYWIEGAPPRAFERVGAIAPSAKEIALASQFTAPWEMLPNVVYRDWRRTHDADALAREVAKDKEDSAKKRADALAALRASDAFDLTGLVPLEKPIGEREPEDVVLGFIAAMNQWEKECARIDKKTDDVGGLSFELSAPAMKTIFDEFCTKADGAYGRRGSYSMPPEYDPKKERVTKVTKKPRAAEVETMRKNPLVRSVRYVLKKTDGWRIDAVFKDGRKSIL